MALQNVTTSDLFERIGNTERTRSAKANRVFRELRQAMTLDHHANTEDHTPDATSSLSLQMKLASRQAR